MSPPQLDLPNDQPSRLRRVVATIEIHIARLSMEGTAEEHRTAASALALSWAGLLEILDLGPQPETRACPSCQGRARRQATLCGYCWSKLEPLAAPAPVQPAGIS